MSQGEPTQAERLAASIAHDLRCYGAAHLMRRECEVVLAALSSRPTPSPEPRIDPGTVERCAEAVSSLSRKNDIEDGALAAAESAIRSLLTDGRPETKQLPRCAACGEYMPPHAPHMCASWPPTPSSSPAEEREIEETIVRIANEMHFELHTKMYRVGSEQLRTYYSGFNISELAKRVAVALRSHPPAADGWRSPITDNDLYYLRSIKRQMDTVKESLADEVGFSLGGMAFADNLDWLDCFIDKWERKLAPAPPAAREKE